MSNHFVVGLSDKMITLRGAVSTRTGWKHLLQLLGYVILWAAFRALIGIQEYGRRLLKVVHRGNDIG